MREGSAGEGLLAGLRAAFQQQLLQCPDGAADPGADPRASIPLCVCLPRLGRQLAQGELQPASSREFAHKS